MEEKKTKFQRDYVVSVFDDRTPPPPQGVEQIAKRNVKAKITVPGLTHTSMMVLIILFALKETYPKSGDCDKHCTSIRVYAADQGGRVVDGGSFISFNLKDESNDVVKEVRERLNKKPEVKRGRS